MALLSPGVVTSSILSFGHAIRRRRESRNLGLRALARATSLSPSYLSRIERDHVPPPTVGVIGRLAEALEADTEDLLAAAGIVPDRVLSFIRSRPSVAVPLITMLGTLTDDELSEMFGELRRRAPAWNDAVDDRSGVLCAPFLKQ